MSIFDSIIDTIKPLTNVYNEVDDLQKKVTNRSLKELAQGYVRGVDDQVEKNVSRAEQYLQKPSRRNVSVDAGKTKWGFDNYASDPAAVEQRWQSILTTFLTPNATKGK